MFHDDQIRNIDELSQWHKVYNQLADSVTVSIKKFLEIWEEVGKCVHSSNNTVHATTQLLMYEFVEPIDGVTILVRKGSSRNCSQLLRTAFEIELSLRYILEDATNYERRSLAYEYYHLLDDLHWVQKCDPDHEMGKQLRSELQGDEHADLFDIKAKEFDPKKQAELREQNLNSTRYAIVREEIDRIKGEKKKARQSNKSFNESISNWYSLWGGPNNIRTLAIHLKLLSHYEALYRSWSKTTHGEGALKRIHGRADDGRINLDPLRSPVDLPEKCVHACHMTNGLILTVVEKLVPHLREGLRGWYSSTMKPALAFIKSIRVKG